MSLICLAPPTTEVGDISYEDIVEEAAQSCRNARPEKVNIELLWELVEIEKRNGVPINFRGMLLASACHESGFNPNARGDYRVTRRRGRSPRALGLFQMWPWWEKSYHVVRTDPVASAEAYLKHIMSMLNKVKRRCKIQSEDRNWIVAWVTAIRAPKPGGRCHQRPKHLRVLRRWYRNIRRSYETDGCDC
jgi:hypothetical protein